MKKLLVILGLMSVAWGYEYCFEKAGRRYGINPLLLYAIAKVESNFNPRALNYNENGTYDIGVMQINSSWLPVLRKYGIREESLYNPCINVHVGAWVLAQCVAKYGWSWRAIDCYNKGSKARENSEYVWKVYYAYVESRRGIVRHRNNSLARQRKYAEKRRSFAKQTQKTVKLSSYLTR